MNNQILYVLYFSVFATILGLGIIGPVMPIYAESLGAGGVWLGIIFAAFSLSRGIFMPIMGKLSDERGRKKFIMAGLFAYFIISFLYPLAASVYSLALVRFVHGMVSAVVIPIAMAYVAELAPPGQEGKTMGTFNQAMFLGMGCGPLLGGILYSYGGFSTVFYPLSILTALAFLMVTFLLPEKTGTTMPKGTVSFTKILKNRIISGLLIFRIIGALGRGGVMSFIPLYASRLDMPTPLIGVVVSAPILLTAVLQRPFGSLSDKYSNKLVFVLAGSILGAFGLTMVPLTHNFVTLLIALCFMGLGGAISMPAATAIAVVAGRDLGLGATMGVFNTAMSVGMVAGPLLAGAMMEALGLNTIFYMGGLISLVGVVFFTIFIWTEYNREKDV